MTGSNGGIDLIGVRFDGSGRERGQSLAAEALREAGLIGGLADAREWPDVHSGSPTSQRGAFGFVNEDALLQMVDGVHGAVATSLKDGRFPVVYGADCAVLLGAIPALHAVVDRPGLLFVDGHEDASPRDAADGEAANTEIALLLGLHDDDALPTAWVDALPALTSDAVVMLGQRDASSRAEMNAASIADRVELHTADDLHARLDIVNDVLARLNADTDGWWFHVDVDVLRGSDFPACGAATDDTMPGGLTWDELTAVSAAAAGARRCRGWSVGVHNTDLDPDRTSARRLVQFMHDVLGRASIS